MKRLTKPQNSSITTTVSPESIRDDSVLEQLEALLDKDVAKLVGPDGEEVELPEPIYELLHKVVRALVGGEKVSLYPEDLIVTTSKAAEILNVSRPYLIKLLDNGDIPSAPSVGSHRRVRAKDVLSYKENRDGQRRKSIRNLVKLKKEKGLYDD